MESSAAAILRWLAEGLLFGTALAGITWVVTVTLLRRARPALHVALWTVVLVKFLVPVGPSAPMSLAGFLGVERLEAPATAPIAEGVATSVASSMQATTAAGSAGFGLLLWILLATYFAAVLTRAVQRIRAYRRIVRRTRSLPEAGSEVAGLIAEGCRDLKLRRAPRSVLCGDGESPHVVSGFDPVLAVPQWLVGRPELRAVILHELAHLRRRDPWWRCLEEAVVMAFFFWPVVGWVRRRLDGAREQACDQWAVKRSGIGGRQFAGILLEVARRTQSRQPLLLAMAGRRSALEGRVRRLVRHGEGTPKLGVALALTVVLWSGLALAGPADGESMGRDGLLCATDPSISLRIMASNPEADVDGDGRLSKKEVCEHQLRMKRKLVGALARNGQMTSRVDRNGDGQLTEGELASFASQVEIRVEEDEVARSSRLVVVARDSSTARSRYAFGAEAGSLETAEVSGRVCEVSPDRCVASQSALGEPAQSLLLIDVAVGDLSLIQSSEPNLDMFNPVSGKQP